MTLGVLAEIIMGLYFQNFPSDEEFFDKDDFRVQLSMAYGSLLWNDYQTQKLINKQEDGFSVAMLSPDILKAVEVDIVKGQHDDRYYIKLPRQPIVFPFDTMSSAIESVTPVGKGSCGEFIKMSLSDRWKVCLLQKAPTSRSYFTVENDRIVVDLLACKDLKKVRVLYAPAFDSSCDDMDIPEVRAFQLQTMVLQVMLAARDGKVIDMSNNSNNNVTLQTEIDSNQLKK